MNVPYLGGMNNGLICILDALGTKGIWNREDAERYLQSLKAVHSNLIAFKEYADSKKMLHAKFEYLTISDTLIIVWKFTEKIQIDSPYRMIPIFARMIDGIFKLCFAEKLFMRGAISYGQFIKDGSILVGPAVDDAATFHELPNMIGAILTPNTTLLADVGLEDLAKAPIDGYDHSQHLIKYNTPIKGGQEIMLYQVNWPLSMKKAWAELPESSTDISKIKNWLGENPIPLEAFAKYENTLKFFEYSSRQK